MNVKIEHKLTEGNIFKGILFFILPIILGNLIQQLYIVVDAVIVGQFVGKEGIAAINITGDLLLIGVFRMGVTGLAFTIMFLIRNKWRKKGGQSII